MGQLQNMSQLVQLCRHLEDNYGQSLIIRLEHINYAQTCLISNTVLYNVIFMHKIQEMHTCHTSDLLKYVPVL